jgi:ATP-dependent DNA helicase RecG
MKPTTMTVGAIRKLVQQAVNEFAPLVPSALPESVARAARVADLPTALRAVHAPEADADADVLNAFGSGYHRSLVFDELFFLQLGLTLRRRATLRDAGIAMKGTGRLSGKLDELLPFALTGAQRRVIEEIRGDVAQPHPMHRLVQGDVGSGKTVVALYAALAAIENGHQAAFMAPTELLAEQHFRTVSPFAERLDVRAALLTGEMSRAEKSRVHQALGRREIDLVVGTHALIQEGVQVPALGLGVIDEQHRFGVMQRAALRRLRSNEDGPAPHILLMTATPIPRTLAMTVYGDLDISALDEMPPGRQPVRTLVYSESERQRAYQLVKQELDRGRQAYVVYPLVESSEKEDLRDATTMATELANTVFADYADRIGLLHGRLKSDAKDKMMRRFRDGSLQLLVSTTVIEVGVDVPNATVMVVEHAERFGLSQLHQLRGRVGRGSERSLCILIAPYRREGDVERRMQAMRETTDGFRIAEIDLDLRGPGEFLGTRQSGLPDFRVANLIRDSRILAEARRSAEAWLAEDPELSKPESASLREVLKHRWAGRLGLATIG